MKDSLKAPFPYFGGKSRVSDLVWSRLGDVANYVEPFFGSGAVLLGRLQWDVRIDAWQDTKSRIETVNDLDGMIANFWRSVQFSPEETAGYADWPINEIDLHARHIWLVEHRADLTDRLQGDPHYYDAKVAGWWVWGLSSWIGSGWCSGDGPWTSVDGKLVRREGDSRAQGVRRKIPSISHEQGIARQRPYLGSGMGVSKQKPSLLASRRSGTGADLLLWFSSLSQRLRSVRVCCGDWQRICTPGLTYKEGLTGVFLDPPYGQVERDDRLYNVDSLGLSEQVRTWTIANGDNPLMRIILCGYDTEHEMPEGWTAVRWKANGGYGNQGDGQGRENSSREVIWSSPYCLKEKQEQISMWDFLEDSITEKDTE